MPLFTISVDSFQITDTRSVHTDTNYGSITYRVVDEIDRVETAFNDPQYGNYNNGTYPGHLVCVGLPVNPNIPLTFNYLLLNAGFTNKENAQGVLEDVGSNMVGSSSYPAFTSCLQQVAAQYAGTFNKILRPGCDGLVAAEQNTFTYADLSSRTSGTPAIFTHSTTHIGPTIAHSCNPRPSHYIVNWSVSQVAAVPDLGGMLGDSSPKPGLPTAKATLQSLGFGYSPHVTNSKDRYPTVQRQDPQSGTLAPLRSNVQVWLA
jgi:hypothetical protein